MQSRLLMRGFFLLFLVVPIVEMLILFEVSDHIGAFVTVGLVLLTAVVGVQILKLQGVSTLTRANERLRSGQLPAEEMLEGMFLAVGGALLLTPGFVTDTFGFLCLIPQTRRLMVRKLLSSGRFRVYGVNSHHEPGPPPGSGGPDGGNVYEGEYDRERPSGRRLDRDEK